VTEPEYVAECGGIAGEDKDGNMVVIPGLGCCWGDGEGCELADHVDASIWYAGPYTADNKPENCSKVLDPDKKFVDLSVYDKNGDDMIKLSEIMCEQIEIGELPGCQSYWIDLTLRLQDVPEEALSLNYFNESIPAELKWNDWPTNALMYDKVEFDISFELLSHPPPTPTPTPTQIP